MKLRLKKHRKWMVFIVASLLIHLIWIAALRSVWPSDSTAKKSKVTFKVVENKRQITTTNPSAKTIDRQQATTQATEVRKQSPGAMLQGKKEGFLNDLSSQPALVSVEFPEYTEPAIEASLEGQYIVDVYVNKIGTVEKAKLRVRVGYGMDRRLIASAKRAIFTARKNRLGGPIGGWSMINFKLRIP